MKTLDLFDLTGQTIIVTGGQGLVGKIVCDTIADLGGTAISLDNHLNNKSGAPNWLCDITLLTRVEEIAEQYEQVHGIVHCAVGNQKPVTFPESQWDSDLLVGLTGAMNVMTAFQNRIVRGGVVLFIGSDLSLQAPSPRRYHPQYKPLGYSVVKHGIIGMMRYYAAVWGTERGIRVNCLCPGGIEQGQMIPDCPLGRLAQENELKGPIALLLSSASSYMTGSIVNVDGGTTWYYGANATQRGPTP